ncbi:hypothetical protein Hanom_Chr02g00145041 [Helianthus anomalus]
MFDESNGSWRNKSVSPSVIQFRRLDSLFRQDAVSSSLIRQVISDSLCVCTIYSLFVDKERGNTEASTERKHTHTLRESLQNRFVNIELVTEPFIRINTSGVNR